MSPSEFQTIIEAFNELRKTVKEDINAIGGTLVKYMEKQDKMSDKIDKMSDRMDKVSDKLDRHIEDNKKMFDEHEKWLRDHDVRICHVEEAAKK